MPISVAVHVKRTAWALGAVLALSGCATYHRLPLDKTAVPAASLAQLTHPNGPIPDTLSIDDVVTLALDNNPTLLAARAKSAVARGQTREAGIAPNPALSGTYGFLLGGPGTIAAIGGGLTEDLKALLTLSYRKSAAEQAALSIDADLAWQAWQVASMARQLTVNILAADRRRPIIDGLSQRTGLFARNNTQALAAGDATLVSVVPDLQAEAALRQRLADLDRQSASDRRSLDALLGLDPSVTLRLDAASVIAPLDRTEALAALDSLPDRRPDLLALQFGYHSQEAKLRGAIMSQFPALSVGVSGGHDNSDVRYVGPTVSTELPLFNRNQGNVAIETATRQQLHDEFEARLRGARGDVIGLLDDQTLLRAQLASRRAELPPLERTAAMAEAAHRARDIDERTFLDALTVRDTKLLEISLLETTLLQQELAIAALTGIGMPSLPDNLQVRNP